MIHCILAVALIFVAFGVLFSLLRRRHFHGYHGYHGYGGFGGYGGFHGGCGPGPRGMLRGVFGRLGTSVAQEKVIVEAMDEVRGQGRKLWDELRQARADVAEALRGEALDATKVDGAFARHDSAMAELRSALKGALGKVHGALDADQRKQLAAMLERPFAFQGGC